MTGLQDEGRLVVRHCPASRVEAVAPGGGARDADPVVSRACALAQAAAGTPDSASEAPTFGPA
jgi:hypothetical protein